MIIKNIRKELARDDKVQAKCEYHGRMLKYHRLMLAVTPTVMAETWHEFWKRYHTFWENYHRNRLNQAGEYA